MTPAETKLAELYAELGKNFSGGLSNTSTAKFNDIRHFFGEILGLDHHQDIYVVGAGTRSTNLPIRFAQGGQATTETDLGIGFLILPDGAKFDRFLESASTTVRNYAERGRGHYKAILLIIVTEESPKVARLIKFRNLDLDPKLREHFPEADIKDVGLLETAEPAEKTEEAEVDTPEATPPITPPNQTGLEDVHTEFHRLAEEAGLSLSDKFCLRLIASLMTKRFVILTGLSGSGKTKVAQALGTWIAGRNGILTVPVGADWNGPDNLLGHVDGIQGGYVKAPALSFILEASTNPAKPYFLLLDEMNLSHVERYFSGFLSAIESGEDIPLHANIADITDVPPQLSLPKNLYVVGTVNVDETTYQFSPKVLDRANTLEFRVPVDQLLDFLTNPTSVDLSTLANEHGSGLGDHFSDQFVSRSDEFNAPYFATGATAKTLAEEFGVILSLLQRHGWDCGYRTMKEISRFCAIAEELGADVGFSIDAQILQKILPRLSGSDSQLRHLLIALSLYAMGERSEDAGREWKILDADQLAEMAMDTSTTPELLNSQLETEGREPRFEMAFEKLVRMWRSLDRNGFASFSEN